MIIAGSHFETITGPDRRNDHPTLFYITFLTASPRAHAQTVLGDGASAAAGSLAMTIRETVATMPIQSQ